MKTVIAKYLAVIGKKGGKSVSEKKRRAARRNGRKSGKPKIA